ncbi:MAG TPA: transcription termination/antitermination NusG family protein [Pyrinomonadaceae bacterium]|nr:transcription termination/antitermination NusG family protein [Pyrinomonadaceae bacterium]
MSRAHISDTPLWYAIHTKPMQEERAGSNLRAWSVETFTPKIKVRRYNQFTGKISLVTKPLFPRYIFARFSAAALLHKVCFTRGVQSVVGFGAGPDPVSDEIIEVIKQREDKDGLVQLYDDLNRGDKVVISDGPLKDFVGVFDGHAKDRDRVSILLTTVSYQNRILIERGLVRKVS